MKMKLTRLFPAFLIISLLVSCESGPPGGEVPSDPQPVLKILSPTNVSETAFQINWNIENPLGFQSISVQVATEEDMTNSVSYVHIDDISTNYLLVENLHGATQYYYKVSLLNQGTTVVESAIKNAETSYHVVNMELVSPGELGLIGGSMGAIMALAGNGYEEVLTSVALSPTSNGVFIIFPDMTLRSVYYLAGELDIHDDPSVDFPAETQSLYELTEGPRKLNIIPGTADHGTNLLVRDSLNTSIQEWFRAMLPLLDS